MYNENIIVHLQISSFMDIGSIGATHYYGKLVGYIDNQYTHKDIEKPMNEEDVKKLSEKDDFEYHIGHMTSRFDTEDEIINIARKKYKDIFKEAKVLLLGNSAHIEPKFVIDAPFDMKVELNNLFFEAEQIGYTEKHGFFYCNDEDKMDKLGDRFYKILENIN